MFSTLLISLLSILPVHPSPWGSDSPSEVLIDSLTVYVFLMDECLISQYYTPELTRLNETYSEKGVGFIGYFPNSATSKEAINKFGQDFRIDFPLKIDDDQFFVKKFEINVTPEVAVWDHRSDRLIYRGRIDDSYVRVGKRKLHPQHHDLEDIINAWIALESTDQLTETQAIGCFINFDSPGK